MNRVPFDPKELEAVGTIPPAFPGLPATPIYQYPITRKENFNLLLAGEKPLWMPHAQEIFMFSPGCMPDNWARGTVDRPVPPEESEYGGADMFGVQWTYDPVSKGATVHPGNPVVKDLEHWEDYITFPDVDSWDWAASAAETAEMRADGRLVKITMYSCLFERLVSFVDMEEALVAMLDEDLQPAVHRLFDKLCGLYEQMFAKFEEYFHADMVWFHDDWGTQRAPFFSLDTVREMLLPYLKRCVDSAHRHGITFEFHSCGFLEPLVPAMIEAGCDLLHAQEVNDFKKLTEKYGDKILIHNVPDFPAEGTPEEKAAAIESFLAEYEGLRTFVGLHPVGTMIPKDEYRYVYELSRKGFNPAG